ncbi:F-box protein [Candidatus Paracaedibacter symbiosus]|uniref:F-box protein n=1 Tax=Candidatus Paracaedibacter symbiosus TaxID=244582 RepID=UPI000509C76B|nr:F-box protein [Candidatus Paracaedibacter symbiosus]
MKILTKILLLFLSAAPMTVLAMEVDDINPSKGTKRPYSSIKSEEEEEKSQEHKRQRTQAQEIIDALDQKEPGEKFREIHKGSEKYKKIDEFENYLGSLKKLTPEFRNIALGNDPERRLGMMEDVLEQLKKRYYRDFFAKPTSSNFNITDYLSDELKQKILSYCSKKDLANLMLVSHDVRDAVYSLMPVFREVEKYGNYKDINEFLDEFYQGNPRAYAAAGITQYQSLNKKSNQRNKWLDLAFEKCDLSAVSFVFQNRLFMNADGDKDNVYDNLKIIEQVYEKQGLGKDLSLDKGIAKYLDHLVGICNSKKEVLSVVKILTASLAGSIEANLILYDAYLTGIVTKSKKKIIVLPKDTAKANEYYRKANEIANVLPNFERGMAHYEIGFWQLAKSSIYRKIPATDPILKIINQQWEGAIDAWTEAEEGNRQKAVAHFKKVLMESPLFPRRPMLSEYPSSNPTFLSTTEHLTGRMSENEYIPFKFLAELYKKDKEADDQLKPYHHDIDMLLIAARNKMYYYVFFDVLTPDALSEFSEASDRFKYAINMRLKDCNKGARDKFINELNAIPQGNLTSKLTRKETLEAYERILEQLGLGDPSIMLSPVE